MRLRAGQPAPDFSVRDIDGNEITLNDLAGRKTLVAFFRHAGCPFCNLRVAEMIRAYPELEKSGLQIVSFWQSEEAELRDGAGSQKPAFPMIADRKKTVYRRYGVENHWAAPLKVLLQPALAWQAIRSPYMKNRMNGENDLIPADFLLSEDLTIHTAYYGSHVGDHIPLSEVRSFLAERPERLAAQPLAQAM